MFFPVNTFSKFPVLSLQNLQPLFFCLGPTDILKPSVSNILSPVAIRRQHKLLVFQFVANITIQVENLDAIYKHLLAPNTVNLVLCADNLFSLWRLLLLFFDEGFEPSWSHLNQVSFEIV